MSSFQSVKLSTFWLCTFQQPHMRQNLTLISHPFPRNYPQIFKLSLKLSRPTPITLSVHCKASRWEFFRHLETVDLRQSQGLKVCSHCMCQRAASTRIAYSWANQSNCPRNLDRTFDCLAHEYATRVDRCTLSQHHLDTIHHWHTMGSSLSNAP